MLPLPPLTDATTTSHNLPRWALRLALRSAQLVNEARPEEEIVLRLCRHADGSVTVVTPKREVLDAG